MDSPSEDRPFRDQRRRFKCFSKQKKDLQKFFQAISKKGLQKIFSSDLQERKTKKLLANFLRGFWRFPTKF